MALILYSLKDYFISSGKLDLEVMSMSACLGVLRVKKKNDALPEIDARVRIFFFFLRKKNIDALPKIDARVNEKQSSYFVWPKVEK